MVANVANKTYCDHARKTTATSLRRPVNQSNLFSLSAESANLTTRARWRWEFLCSCKSSGQFASRIIHYLHHIARVPCLVDLFWKTLRFMRNSLKSCVVVTWQTFTRAIHIGKRFMQRDATQFSVGTIPRGKLRRVIYKFQHLPYTITDKETSVRMRVGSL